MVDRNDADICGLLQTAAKNGRGYRYQFCRRKGDDENVYYNPELCKYGWKVDYCVLKKPGCVPPATATAVANTVAISPVPCPASTQNGGVAYSCPTAAQCCANMYRYAYSQYQCTNTWWGVCSAWDTVTNYAYSTKCCSTGNSCSSPSDALVDPRNGLNINDDGVTGSCPSGNTNGVGKAQWYSSFR